MRMSLMRRHKTAVPNPKRGHDTLQFPAVVSSSVPAGSALSDRTLPDRHGAHACRRN